MLQGKPLHFPNSHLHNYFYWNTFTLSFSNFCISAHFCHCRGIFHIWNLVIHIQSYIFWPFCSFLVLHFRVTRIYRVFS